MTISKEQRDELRRLYALWREEPRDYGARDTFTDEARDLAIPLLDALDAAEAERDRLREALKHISSMSASPDAEEAQTTLVSVLIYARATRTGTPPHD